ncbi:hypothetical protein [Pedobacter psychrodurus]|uniref:hypothetical protein n=1 Tax=Pedobacter psychrodurus TaxID=2530456 RepID=UPI00292D7A25|nr:hypothetical protein [Pedobacter psychrodurus]
MKIVLLSPTWGHEDLPITIFLDKVRAAGYHGVDTWVPTQHKEKQLLFNYLQKHQMYSVAHQHQATGKTFSQFCKSFAKNLNECAEADPLLINSHTGKDYFSFQQNLALLDIANEFTDKTGVRVAHETHRGRFGYSPQMLDDFFKSDSPFLLTADFSHWVCVTESMLEHFGPQLKRAIGVSRHIHARFGYEQGPQVPDPRDPRWEYVKRKFFKWWDEIVAINVKINTPILPITTEFGPHPYMINMPFTEQALTDQFEVNLYLKELISTRYGI